MAKTAKKTSARSSGSKKTAAKKSTRSTAKASSRKSSANSSPKDPKEELMKLFEHALKDMYWAEKALTKAIPKMAKKAQAPELRKALEDHLRATEGQVSKLEKVFSGIDKKAQAKKCDGMDGIMKEGDSLMTEFKGPSLDSAIIAAAQKVEHYEISSYNSMITLARALDLPKEADLLEQVLREEMEADKLLANIAVKETHNMLVD